MTEERRAPTLVDVARASGVSHQTVSRVLNGFAGIRPATRDRVLAAIDELGYRRNLAARALAAGRTHSIGILTPSVPEHGPTSSLFAVEGAAREHGYRPLVTAAAADDAATRAALGFLLDQAVEALVVVVPHAGVVRALEDLGVVLPVVALQAPAGPTGDVVGVDHARGARLATEHLVALGHRRIQHVSGPAGWTESAARRRGVAEALDAAGLERLPVIEGDWTAAAGFEAAGRLDPGVTAVACANDQLAIGVMAALADSGRRVPDDISVTGFDDLPEAAFLRPALTTVRQDFDEIGRRAVELIVRRLDGDGGGAVQRIAIEPELVVRSSTAPARPDRV
ncbi:LacI family DNA-binding transcriptional regulator [Pseudolysinimonas sp.]|uniref:LacI family DNA-binding transcriptional regulator n=1 Tax=Pseudolysinimonas sp. TaxID=2680009 RepID=UPI003F7DB31B